MLFTKIQHSIQQFKRHERDFDDVALELFRFQAIYNKDYSDFCQYLGVHINNVNTVEQIPFIPIQTFRKSLVKTDNWSEELIFKSSGTNNVHKRSSHAVFSIEEYQANCLENFIQFYGPVDDAVILALLPNYQENSASSLICMVDHLMAKGHKNSSYVLEDSSLIDQILLANSDKKIFLFGVSYALLDLKTSLDKRAWSNVTILETGGMKGTRPEMIKEEMYVEIKKSLPVDNLFSEYGMTELFSQAYTLEETIFTPVQSMQVLIHQINDPLELERNTKTGLISVIDLLNYRTCSFIQTQDLGQKLDENRFKISGRVEQSDIRGCNLLLSDLNF